MQKTDVSVSFPAALQAAAARYGPHQELAEGYKQVAKAAAIHAGQQNYNVFFMGWMDKMSR